MFFPVCRLCLCLFPGLSLCLWEGADCPLEAVYHVSTCSPRPDICLSVFTLPLCTQIAIVPDCFASFSLTLAQCLSLTVQRAALCLKDSFKGAQRAEDEAVPFKKKWLMEEGNTGPVHYRTLFQKVGLAPHVRGWVRSIGGILSTVPGVLGREAY